MAIRDQAWCGSGVPSSVRGYHQCGGSHSIPLFLSYMSQYLKSRLLQAAYIGLTFLVKISINLLFENFLFFNDTVVYNLCSQKHYLRKQ